MDPLYDDGGLLLDASGITIRRYYFPWGGSKRIGLDQLRGVESRPLGWATGKGRLWGTAHPRYWLPLDRDRFRRDTALVLDTGRWIRPTVTPDDPDRVLELLRART